MRTVYSYTRIHNTCIRVGEFLVGGSGSAGLFYLKVPAVNLTTFKYTIKSPFSDNLDFFCFDKYRKLVCRFTT